MNNYQFDKSEQNTRIRQKTVVKQAMERIRALLTSGDYKAGDRIPTEQKLAEQFGIGRSSVREATKIFEYLGILESRVPKGTFLCDKSHISGEAISWSIFLDTDDMWEVILLRQVLEEAAFRLAMIRGLRNPAIMDAYLKDLEAVVRTMREAAAEGSIERLVHADYSFHAVIFSSSGISIFQNVYNTLHAFMDEEIAKTYRAQPSLWNTPRDHQGIVDVVRNGNLKKAIARHHQHFNRIKRLLQQEMAMAGKPHKTDLLGTFNSLPTAPQSP
jgi:DNA-binding FadR family transcriptional regulator